ncbi:helix-turn-helix domain-containing protein [Paenibacillus glycinis]|uniref:Helix-turn-helix domain-containing protein n=1 Tax=Paenibacillus glycinis TaxID=2697035 RepID=A0ABW9XS86_9BACL|nr:helix-turn-helix domain-containing protein [Paenibacillus glycinis]NBD25338.1 helix-turn-helix domain-containing protein [Paenibacillus glycinis]
MYNVLIIDDERLIAEGVKAKLERAGLREISEIRVACGGEEGLRTAAAYKPHIVITDMRMPDIDGVQVIRRLSSELPRTKFILLSGYGDYAYVREAFKYGVLDYVLKPAGSAELADQIRSAVAAIEEDGRLAAMAERNRQAEHLALAARLNALLNDPAAADVNEGDSADCAMTEAYLIHAHAVVALFHVSGSSYSSADLALVESVLEGKAGANEPTDRIRPVVFHDGGGRVCAVINFTAAVTPDALASLLEDAVARIKRTGSDRAAVFVSEFGTPAGLRQLYEQVRLAMAYRILREPSDVFLWQPVMPAVGREELSPARKDIEALRLAVDTLQLDRIDLWIDRWLPDSLIGAASLEQVEAVYALLLTEIRRRFDGRLPSERSDPVRALASFHALSDLRRYLKAYAGTAKQFADEHAEPEETVVSFAQAYVKEHFNRDIQLAEMANRVSMNYSYFSTLFKERTGSTFTAYLIQVRMEEARKLLQDPTLRINEVSDRVGYGNLYHFSRAFKNYFGMSPKEYRRSR